jgi:hypothetical protein
MKREDSFLLPMCNHCGKYKGIGYCKNPVCPEFQRRLNTGESEMRGDSSNKSVKQSCSICGKEQVIACTQCGQGYCQIHGAGSESKQLLSFHQRVGTCIECQEVVCENCWILNPNGDIICLTHVERERKK